MADGVNGVEGLARLAGPRVNAMHQGSEPPDDRGRGDTSPVVDAGSRLSP